MNSTETSPDIAVVGLGNWGTALAHHLGEKGHSVLGWTIDESVADTINSTHKHPLYLTDSTLSSNLRATQDPKALAECGVVVLVVPSSALSDVLPRLDISDDATVVSAIKGIDETTLKTPLQLCEELLPNVRRRAVLSGPSFAADIVAGQPAGVVAASTDSDVARSVAELFSGNSLRVYTSTDPLGVELGGIVKNVIALAVGICDGLELGDSARAGLITRGLAEMMRFAEAHGAQSKTLSGLSGLGDLVVTTTSNKSRNRTVGLRLGGGEKLADIIATVGSVAEGVRVTPLVLQLAEQKSVEMPITDAVNRVLLGEITAQDMASALINRPIKAE